jgi:hypothetical protein
MLCVVSRADSSYAIPKMLILGQTKYTVDVVDLVAQGEILERQALDASPDVSESTNPEPVQPFNPFVTSTMLRTNSVPWHVSPAQPARSHSHLQGHHPRPDKIHSGVSSNSSLRVRSLSVNPEPVQPFNPFVTSTMLRTNSVPWHVSPAQPAIRRTRRSG